jgi:apolipoprotein N-acyltransferase
MSGPRVLAIQSDVRYLTGGAPAIDHQRSADHLLNVLKEALAAEPTELVVLPEGAFPPLNDEARRELARSAMGPAVERTYQRLMQLAKDHDTALVVGANAVTGWRTQNGEHFGSEIRNSAYFFDPHAKTPLSRYDKIQLVRFAERPALSGGPSWLVALAGYVSAARAAQPLVAGTLADFRPFRLEWQTAKADSTAANATARASGTAERASAFFVAPICLENIDPLAVRLMIGGSSLGSKRAQFIANISNDGWFGIQEKHQHLQTVIFRCIENRVPMVRCSNTGVSAFVDSRGRVQETLGTNVERWSARQLELDNRETFYMRYGDVVATSCVFIVGVVWAASVVHWLIERRARNHVASAKKR